MKCESCLKEKEIFVSGWCKQCSEKLDNHLLKTKKERNLANDKLKGGKTNGRTRNIETRNRHN